MRFGDTDLKTKVSTNIYIAIQNNFVDRIISLWDLIPFMDACRIRKVEIRGFILREQLKMLGGNECRISTDTNFHLYLFKDIKMVAICLFLAELLQFEITSIETIADLSAIAYPHSTSILKTFLRQIYTKSKPIKF